ncbi:MAG: efflux RND transporter periplasmic adaptor subunit [Pseudomonadota bacterium]|jgi:membrane fusion protein (multidrug efflux system)|nr:MAG: efflux transporter periplasmic adaptor subunit [Pseudomonadota bacterium]
MPALSLRKYAVAAAAFLAACLPASAADPGATPPPVTVSIITTEKQDLPILEELPGRIAPMRIAEVRPRVSGIVIERVFTQGSLVKEGDVLYRIDPEPFRVQVESAKATLRRAEAAQLRARQQADRQRELHKRNISSPQQLEEALAALAQADADVAAAQAGLRAAELNLHYTEVRAPISGRIGRALITEGALVDSSDKLATIQQLDPVYADFTQSVNALRALRRAVREGLISSVSEDEMKVQLRFDDGTEYPYPGRLLFSEATVEATTGQVIMRGQFPNPDGDLLPGMYVRVVVEQGVQHDVIAVPQQAVQRDASGRSQVYVVKPDGTVELRTVRTGRVVGNNWVIEEGLAAGERVVVEGFQKIRPGVTVDAQAWKHDVNAPTRTAKRTDAAQSSPH